MLNEILHRSMGESDWSVEPTLVDEHGIHILATCHCESCIGIRALTTPSPEEMADIEQMIQEDESKAAHSESWRRESVGLRAWRAREFPPKELAG